MGSVYTHYSVLLLRSSDSPFFQPVTKINVLNAAQWLLSGLIPSYLHVEGQYLNPYST